MTIRDVVDANEDQGEDQHARESLRAVLTEPLSSVELRSALDGEPGFRPELHARWRPARPATGRRVPTPGCTIAAPGQPSAYPAARRPTVTH
jgi:hypothetical protein